MKLNKLENNYPWIGIAHSEFVNRFIKTHRALIDYIEIPFELLQYNPDVIGIADTMPVILHCASLSVAGSIPPEAKTIEAIDYWIGKTGTPWLGEHLSFITAPDSDSLRFADEYAPGQAYNIGYTMPPPLNREALDGIKQAIESANKNFNVPLILENPPIYFPIPGSKMDQITFINELVNETGVGLLLDLAHFYITAQNERFDPVEKISELPLEKVVEIHVSGVELQHGTYWDNHAGSVPEVEYVLLEKVLANSRPRAITLEFNWNSEYPEDLLVKEINRVKEIVHVTC